MSKRIHKGLEGHFKTNEEFEAQCLNVKNNLKNKARKEGYGQIRVLNAKEFDLYTNRSQ